MKRISLFLSVLFFSFLVKSQDKLLTISDAAIGQWFELGPQDLQNLKWRSENSYTYIADYQYLIEGFINNQDCDTIVRLAELNGKLQKFGFQLSLLYEYSWKDDETLIIREKNYLFIYNVVNKSIEKYFEFDANANLSNDKDIYYNYSVEADKIAYTKGNNLFVINSNSEITQLTDDKNPGIVNGSDYVHRQEFGIKMGTFWSPDGKYLAFYRNDQSQVTDYPVINIEPRIAEVEKIKYPMAGMKSEEVTLGIYNFETRGTTFITTKEFSSEEYLTCVTWDPSGHFIYIAVLNREQNHLKLNKYEVGTGKIIKTLFEEQNAKYVEPENPMLFLHTKPGQFLWQSERDGYNHIYLYNSEGQLLKQLTKGEWAVTKLIGLDKKETELFYISTQENPTERHLYSLNLTNGMSAKLTDYEGEHEGVLSPQGSYIIDCYSNLNVPNKIDLKKSNGKFIRNLLTASNPLLDYKLGKIEMLRIKAADKKTDLYAKLIKPIDFDPNKKYPVIIYVYGGPHDQLVKNSWLADTRLWQFYMAQKGFVMFTLDNRGSDGRGLEFENCTHRQLGFLEMQDQMEGVKFLKSLTYVDSLQIGIHGWSFGGFMTISLMLNYPEVFKVGVAGGPVIDWKYYEVMYGERYMDTPQENIDGYEKTSLLKKADKLKGKLLIIHGGVDPVVVQQNSLMFIQECIKERRQVDYFVYPLHEHNVRGYDRMHLEEKISRYFEDFLKN